MQTKNVEYSIVCEAPLNNVDRKIISYFYKTIFGFEAINLYNLFYEQFEFSGYNPKKFVSANKLLKILCIDEEKLWSLTKILEQVKLIRSFMRTNLVGDKQQWIIFLQKPFSLNEFLSMPGFNEKLLEILGEDIFNEYKSELTNYQLDLNENFKEMTDDKSLINKNIKPTKKEKIYLKNKLGIKTKRTEIAKIDYNYLIKILSDKNINIEFDNEMQDLMNRSYSMISFSNNSLIRAIENSYNFEKQKLNKNKFSKEIYNAGLDSTIFEDSISTGSSEKINKKTLLNARYKEMENNESKEYVKKLTGQKSLSTDIIYNIDFLKNELKLFEPVINAIYDYTWIHNDKKLVTNYINKIANTMLEKNINTADKARKYFLTIEKNKRGKIFNSDFDVEVRSWGKDESSYQAVLDEHLDVKEILEEAKKFNEKQ